MTNPEVNEKNRACIVSRRKQRKRSDRRTTQMEARWKEEDREREEVAAQRANWKNKNK